MYIRHLMERVFKTFICFLVVVTSCKVAAQDYKKDSIYRVYQSAEADSVRVKAGYLLLSRYIQNIDPDSAYIFARKLLEKSREVKDTLTNAHLADLLGTLSIYRGENYQGLHFQLEALKLYEAKQDSAGLSKMYNNIGESYYELDIFNEAYDYYNKALNASEQLDHKLGEAIAIYNIGKVLKAQGQLTKAQYFLQEAMELSQSIDDAEGVAYALHDIGEIQILRGRPKLAQETLKKALDQGMKLEQELEIQVLLPQILNKTGEAYRLTGDYENSIIYYDSALTYYDRLKNEQKKAISVLGKGRTYEAAGNEPGAESFYSQALTIAKEFNDATLMTEIYLELSELYERQDDYIRALEFFKKYKNKEDSVFSKKKNEQFAQLQIKYETQKKDLEIDLLNERKVQQDAQLENQEFIRNVLVVILAFTAVLLFTLYRSGAKRKKMNDILVNQQQELELQNKENEKLLAVKDKFFSIVSHDLRSPINALVGILDMLHGGHLTQDELQQVTRSLKVRLNNTRKLLDNLLDWAMLQMNEIEMKEEIIELKGLVEENLEFFKEVNDKQLHFFNKVAKSIKVLADRNMLNLIIRNLVSNSIKFTDNEGVVEVLAEEAGGKVVITIQDNGVGMPSDKAGQIFDNSTIMSTPGTANEKGTGLGLKLCKDFVERMGGTIWVESEPGEGSAFKFSIKKA